MEGLPDNGGVGMASTVGDRLGVLRDDAIAAALESAILGDCKGDCNASVE